MSEETKGIVITLICIVFIAGIVASCNVANNHSDNISMSDMVKNGADPLAARCAVKNISSAECSIYASKLSGSVFK